MDKEESILIKNIDPKTLDLLVPFINDAEIGIYMTDFNTNEILFVNKKIAMYSGETDGRKFLGKKCWTLIDPNGNERCHFCPYKILLDEKGKPKEPFSWELNLEPADLWLKVISSVIECDDGRLVQIVAFYDITEMKKMQEKLANLAFTDRLLSVKNDLRLERDIGKMREKPSLIIFDISELQKVNEAYGRSTGDKLLTAIKDWVLSLVTEKNELYRVGGDEFCISVENASFAEIRQYAELIQNRFSEPWDLGIGENLHQIFCNASIAVILSDYVYDDEPILNLIERTLKTAKERKAITIYDAKMDSDYKKKLNFEFILKKCTREKMSGFDVFYQPIVDACTGQWHGLEALCRWSAPGIGPVSPDFFITEAERLELIGSIGYWVLETAIRKCKFLKLDKIDNFILHVNVSAAQFIDESLAQKILDLLTFYNYPAEKLCVEITESTQFAFTGQSSGIVGFLRKNNVLVALDDFGTGYSNFYQLKSIPADILKVERALVSDIEDDSYTRYLFKAMAELAHTANMKLVAEGVETKEQKEILTNNGADFLQGYLFSRPLSSADLESQLYLFGNSLLGVNNREVVNCIRALISPKE